MGKREDGRYRLKPSIKEYVLNLFLLSRTVETLAMKEKDGVHGVIWIVNGAITRKLELRRQMLRRYRKAQTSSGMASLRCLRCHPEIHLARFCDCFRA